ncbi:hypothetical protein PR202_gb08419 [Eleusine coracana subsp. coracana]|uniref:F-box domain-containing protein n=1 Tax=Eleusine coracana subsp. coracana TaxID=191504 RepID=A0AAV5EEU9_ELECO|nr:hypothetical protein PR202_gb08419 [Eleusine coracana subsp. coracana]
MEILLRLDSPTWLVRAAAVCRRWLRRASDPAFLRRFRALSARPASSASTSSPAAARRGSSPCLSPWISRPPPAAPFRS